MTIRANTAVLVVHGIGQQLPLETLDEFTRGMIEVLKERKNKKYEIEHLTRVCKEGDLQWFDSYVRINDSQKFIDIHEYYWADVTEEKITVGEILNWLRITLKGARKCFKSNKGLAEEYEENSQKYVRRLTALLRYGIYAYYFLWLINALLKVIGLGKYLNILKLSASSLMVNYIGDVAVYTTTDKKSKFFGVRQKVINGALKQLVDLIKNDEYDQVIIAGHSLGSVVSYDILNKLNLLCNHDEVLREKSKSKITTLCTFGSPLDKIAFFFREQSDEEDYVRRQIITHLHSFKAKPLDNIPRDQMFNSRTKKYLNDIEWLNFYHEADPVSGHLDFYDIPNAKDKSKKGNIPCDFSGQNPKDSKWGFAHLGYWRYKPMYRLMLDKLMDGGVDQKSKEREPEMV